MRIFFLSECSKFNIDFKYLRRNLSKILCFWGNCIWIFCVKLFLLRREYLLKNSVNVLHICKRDFSSSSSLSVINKYGTIQAIYPLNISVKLTCLTSNILRWLYLWFMTPTGTLKPLTGKCQFACSLMAPQTQIYDILLCWPWNASFIVSFFLLNLQKPYLQLPSCFLSLNTAHVSCFLC